MKRKHIADHPQLFNLPAIYDKLIVPVKIIPTPAKVFTPTDDLLSVTQVALYWDVSQHTVNNYKFKKIAGIEYSKMKFKFLERNILRYTNACYYPANIYGEIIDLPPLTLNDRLLKPSDVAEKLKIANGTIANYRMERRISFVKLSDNLFRFAERDVQIFLDRNYRSAMTFLDD